MTKYVRDNIKETLNCMKGSGIVKFSVMDVVEKCFDLFYSDTDWAPNESTIKNELIHFKQNSSIDNYRKGKIVSCGKEGRFDILTWV